MYTKAKSISDFGPPPYHLLEMAVQQNASQVSLITADQVSLFSQSSSLANSSQCVIPRHTANFVLTTFLATCGVLSTAVWGYRRRLSAHESYPGYGPEAGIAMGVWSAFIGLMLRKLWERLVWKFTLGERWFLLSLINGALFMLTLYFTKPMSNPKS